MGRASAGEIFDPIAQVLIDLNAPDHMKLKILTELIARLQAGDWDTEDESLRQFRDDPIVVAAFAANDVPGPDWEEE
jgi:hypothetical protein